MIDAYCLQLRAGAAPIVYARQLNRILMPLRLAHSAALDARLCWLIVPLL